MMLAKFNGRSTSTHSSSVTTQASNSGTSVNSTSPIRRSVIHNRIAIEPSAQARQIFSPLQQQARRSHQPLSLGGVNARGRSSIRIRGAGADLHDRKLRLAQLGDDVELTAAASIISEENARSLRLEICGSRVLGTQPDALLPGEPGAFHVKFA